MAFPKWGIIVDTLEKLNNSLLKPEGFEFYDFGGGALVAPVPDTDNSSGYLNKHMIAVISRENGKNYFSTKEIDLNSASDPKYLVLLVSGLVQELKDGIAKRHEEGSKINASKGTLCTDYRNKI